MYDKVTKLFSKAINGELSILELEQEWPESFEENSFFEELYDDLESAVEHMPGKSIFSHDINIEKFKYSNEYKIIFIDYLLLQANLDFETMITKRQYLFKNLSWSEEQILDILNSV
jgi:hypothetical protein